VSPLDPSGGEGRSWLRRELLRPEYHDGNVVRQVLDWLERTVGRGVDAASRLTPLSTLAAMLVALVLGAALAALLSRARRSARTRRDGHAVLPEERVTAARLRQRADVALAEGRHGDALVDGFRALAVRQVERGRLDDAPGATAHEVADALAASYPHQRQRVDGSAALFERVLYGHRPANRDQAAGVLALDDELAVLR
jgi:hypothetical protein